MDTAEKQKVKHPPLSEAPLPTAVDTCSPQIALKKSVFLEAIRRAQRGSGAGPSGWRYEHLRLVLESLLTSDLLFQVCCLIARGLLPASVVSLFTASRLIALPKGNDDVRPTAIGECLRRLTAKIICLQLKPDHFAPLQHGVATPGGSEMLVHHIQMLLETDPERGILKTDISNVFNCVSRRYLLEEVASHFPEIHTHVRQMYGVSNPLLYFNSKSTSVIPLEDE